MSFLTRTLFQAYGLAWRAATPLLARHKRLAEGFEERLVPTGWPFMEKAGKEDGLPAQGQDSLEKAGKAEPLQRSERPPLIWIQAASGGEAWLAHSLVLALLDLPERQKRPLTLLCTSVTRQGLDILEKLAAEPLVRESSITVLPRYFPLDTPSLMLRAVRAARPRAIVLLETELWPGLMDAAGRENCPVLALNARMSQKSLTGYTWLASFWKEHRPASILAISPEDAARFAALFSPERVTVMPNIKFDRVAQGLEGESRRQPAYPAAMEADSAPALSSGQAIAGYAPLVALASVREEEEQILMPVIRELNAAKHPAGPVRVAVAPRHMHRAPAWKEMLSKEGIPFILRSEHPGNALSRAEIQSSMQPQGRGGLPPAPALLLWDTFGEMQALYGMADAVFVGGSLAPLGGQNFLEPLAEGVIPCVGPHIKNFLWVGEDIFTEGLAVRVSCVEELAPALLKRLLPGTEPYARAASREAVRERFRAWLGPRTGGSLQAARELLRFL